MARLRGGVFGVEGLARGTAFGASTFGSLMEDDRARIAGHRWGRWVW
jgi:hypothetical protein